MRKNLRFPLLFLIALSIVFFSSENDPLLAQNTTEPAQFLRNLRLGDRGNDVKSLQIRLNSNTQTTVASFGAGSPGNETDYFGTLTQKAVEKFQNLHKDEIFATAGISSATGFVGPATRSVLETKNIQTTRSPEVLLPSSSLGAVFSSPSPLLSSSLSLSGTGRVANTVTQTVFLYRVLPAQVAPRGTITLTGAGFDVKDNTVHIGEYDIANIPSLDGKTLVVSLPETPPLRENSVWVENKAGTTKSTASDVRLIITDTPQNPPKITSTSPSVVSINDETVVITGSGFAPTGNNIYSSLGPVMNLSSGDGKTLSFKLSSLSNLGKLKNPNMRGITVSLWVSVQNENGIQVDPFPIIITL